MTVANTNIPMSALEAVQNRETLFAFLHEYLYWPLDQEDTFTYEGPPVPGETAARVEVSRIVPFAANDPFVIMLAEFQAGFRRSDLRDVLKSIRRQMRTQGAYQGRGLEDVIFICAVQGYQGILFAHFWEIEGRQPHLSVFGWNRDHVAETRTLRDVNLPTLRLTVNGNNEPVWDEGVRRRWLSAWDVEAVTKRFFREFHETYDAIMAIIGAMSPRVAEEDLHTFSLTLMNRLLFCWFIQQKRWLAHDPIYLTRIWEQLHVTDTPQDLRADSFYREYMRPLFLHMLNTPPEQRDPEITARMGEIPYLNGGLFEENDLDRRADPANPQRDIFVSNEAIGLLISQRQSDGRPRGLFQRWNFTVQESTPLDVDVAVDPEMLGKVFEELMNEVTGDTGDTQRHQMGAYYTPRPVVSFMCKEALKGYLDSGPAVARFVDEYDASDLPDPEAILARLQRIRVCDPACGSGAYLLGMLQELMTLRRELFQTRHIDPTTDYRRKLDIIQYNLYGVDIEPSAVEIARLRLWLSLVVEFDDGGDLTRVPALPNLDFKIEQGDSLGAPNPETAGNTLFRHADVQRFAQLKAQYGDPNFRGDKATIRREINTLREQIARGEHGGEPVRGFDWRVEFAEVFDESTPVRTMDGRFAFANEIEQQQTFMDADMVLPAGSGFDIVLANPPYVRQENIGPQKEHLLQLYGDPVDGKSDLYCYFYVRALQLLRSGGMHVFVCSNSWLDTGYGGRLQKYLLTHSHVQAVYDSAVERQFATADINTIISIIQKGQPRDDQQTDFISLRAPFEQAIADPTCRRVINMSRTQLWQAGLGEPGRNGARSFIGDKWGGKYLRAPDVYWKIIERAGNRLVRVSDIATTRRGFTTGANDFFYVKIVGEHDGVASIRCDDGSFHELPVNLLKPVIVRPGSITRPRLTEDMADYYMVALPGVEKGRLPALARQYVEWGEREGFHLRSTLRSRRYWYTIEPREPGWVLTPMARKRRPLVGWNEGRLQVDHNLFEVLPSDNAYREIIAACLYSTFAVLDASLLGRANLGQGALKTEGIDIARFSIIHPGRIEQVYHQSMNASFEAIKNRPIQMIYDGVRRADRIALDDAFLAAVGYTDAEERRHIMQELHEATCRLIWERQAKAGTTREARQTYDEWLATGQPFGDVGDEE